MSMDHFRAQLMQNASIHGGVPQQAMLSQKSIEKTEKDIENNARLKKIVDDSIQSGIIKADDELAKYLQTLFVAQAETLDGKERALRMAIFTASKINNKFKIESK